MNALLLVGAAGAPAIAAQVIATVIAFALVVVTLWKVAWKPIIAAIDARREEITSEYKSIDRKTAEAAAILKEYEERIRHIDEEARERHNKAIDEGRRIAEQIVEKARGEAESITNKAREAIQLELAQARVQLRQDMVEMTLAATGKLMATHVDNDAQRRLVNEFITEVESRRAS